MITGLLLDTNVPSELTQKQPSLAVVNWFEQQIDENLFLSVITIGELRKGIVMLPDGRRRTSLETWLEQELIPWFSGRILPVTQAVADRWGILEGRSRIEGRNIKSGDALIAATALHHNLTLVTRNLKDFYPLGVRLLNPWPDRDTKA